MKGFGITKSNGYGKGDELIYINIMIPPNLSEKQKLIVQELAKEFDQDISISNKGFKEKVKQFFDM